MKIRKEEIVENKNCDCKCATNTDEKLVKANVSLVACDFEDLSLLDDVFKKINELEKEHKINCTSITININ
ncbi:hypothetical protein [Anaerococcus tetradius]|uniref:Uncharacterized protein n=1 Tax=Anaerococcus tetradius TaxID=33036 RepID=A0A133KCY7_9FIRM|nr:hypothetical protein [Anaerococcus tetradius]KWZ77441.1 hypothetical protein HMPREF3200_01434 [Anaerococcus tetradius]